MQNNIFITYSWKDKKIVDQLDADLGSVGIPLIRDIRNIKYRGSIKEFMRTIRATDHVLMLISESYLKSKNCMYEVLELLKDDDYKKRLIPIVLNDAHIYDVKGQSSYVQYWKDEYQELDRHMKSLQLSYEEIGADVIKDFKVISQIKMTIWDFLKEISDIKCITFEELKNNNYLEIFQTLGLERPDVLQKLFEIYKMPEGEAREIEFFNFAETYPDNRSLIMVRGEMEETRHNYKLARANYEKVIRLDPMDAGAHHHLAYLLHNFLNEPAEARLHYQKALELNPEDSTIYNNYALLLKNFFAEYTEAKSYYEKAIELNPSYITAMNNLAILLENQFDDYFEAKKLLERALEIDPNNINANFNLGNLYKHHTHEYKKAEYYYLRILEIDPNNAEAHNNLGNLYMDYLVDLDKSRQHLEEALRIDPEMSVVKLNLLLLESREGK